MPYSPVSLESLLTHQGWALRMARRLVREETEAEELVQRAYVAALRRPPRRADAGRAWIRKVIVNLARERHRRDEARTRHERAHVPAVESADASDAAARQEIHRLLGERLMQLDEPYRTVVLQRFFEDLTSVEIAQRLGIPAGTVRWRLKVGLDQLRADLDRRSHGDRSRWVSALLAFAAPRSAGRARAEPAAAASAGLSPLAGWTILGVAAGLLGFFLVRSTEAARGGTVHAAVAEPPAHTPAFADETERASAARVPALAGPLPTAAEPPPQGLALRVSDEHGAPLAADIHVAHADGYRFRTRSDDGGRAWLVVRPEDVGALGLGVTRERVSIRALARGHVASELVHVAPPFGPEHEVTLVVGGPDLHLRGRVLDPEGQPIRGALVAFLVPERELEQVPEGDFRSPSYVSATTGADGTYELAHLPRARGLAVCFAPGFATFSTACFLGERPEQLDFRLARGATVTGVVRRPGGAPAPGVLVSCEPLCKSAEWATGLPGYDARGTGFAETTRTDANGAFRLAGVIAFAEPRALWALDEAQGLAATTSLLLADGSEAHWDAELAERPGLHLRFVDEHERPLAGWVAHARRPLAEMWWVRRVTSDEQGRVRILDCPDGDLLVDLLPPFGLGASRGWRRLRASTEELRIQIDLGRMAAIEGRVLDASGAPAAGALIVLSLETTLETRVELDASGAFAERLTPGAYALLLRLPGTVTKLATLKLAAGEVRALGDRIAPPPGTLRLASAEPLGPALPSYSLYKLPDDPKERGVLLVGSGDIPGELVLTLFPGRYRVQYFPSDPARKSRHRTFVIRAHEELRLVP